MFDLPRYDGASNEDCIFIVSIYFFYVFSEHQADYVFFHCLNGTHSVTDIFIRFISMSNNEYSINHIRNNVALCVHVNHSDALNCIDALKY